MKSLKISSIFLRIVVFLLSFSCEASAHIHHDFLHCLSLHFSNSTTIAKLVYTQNDPSYFSVLNSSIMNLHFASPLTPKPLAIVTPFHASQVQAIIKCSKKHALQIRTRSGGHDSYGLSYLSDVPFVVIDLRNLRSIRVNINKKTAWVQAGATLGEVYYRISEKSGKLGFPAGDCYTVGVGGHFGGGGYGVLIRKYGMAADHIVDAHLVNVDGRVLDRKSMGEDLFWAIRGGGAASFGVVLAWKIKLLDVSSKVTMFNVQRDFELNSTKNLVHRWQYVADKLDKDLLIYVRLQTANSAQGNKKTIQAVFISLFLGGVDKLLPLIEKSFPELGLVRKDCTEMSWIQSMLFINGFPTGSSTRVLLNRTQSVMFSFEAKADYVKEPIPEDVMVKMAERLYREDVGAAFLQMFPYGGRMSEISESEIPFPHRAGNLYELNYLVQWKEKWNVRETERHTNWIRSAFTYMTPYVSKNPRQAYFNFRDLDIGRNNYNGSTSYAQARIWGTKYFKNNFKRLVRVKTRVDPTNFFRNEQSIPPLPSSWKSRGD